MHSVFDRLKTALADRYAIQEELGSGGMATVYLAEDLKHHRKVAVKVLRPELAAALGPERFLREIEIAAGLTHPHILPLHDSGEADGFLYYVMPFVEGESLRARLHREGQLPVVDVVRVLREIADALAHAHKHGVVHRDIKPDNVLLAESHAVVMDFGVAKALSAATGRHELTTAGVALGTPAYMAPEQAAADPNVDQRADIYAVGVMAYEMLSGRPPFTGTTAQEVLSAHLVEAPRPVSERREALPPVLADLVMRCLQKKQAERWQSADEVLRELEQIETPSQGSTAVAAAPRARPAKPARVLAGAAALLVLLLAAVLWISRSDENGSAAAVSSRVVAVLPFSVRGSDELAYLGEGMVTLLSTKLDGAGDLRSVDTRALLSFVTREAASSTDPVQGRRMAERFGAGLYVMGDIVEVSGRIQISASLYDLTRGTETVGEVEVDGEASQVFDLVDQMAAMFLGSLGSGPGARVQQVAAVTTSSLSALKAYLECETAFRVGQYQTAVASCQRAIGHDSTYALAYYRLSVVAELGTLSELAHEAAEQAFRHSGRLTQRDRRMLEGFLAGRRGEHAGAERVYRSLIGSHPDDIEALYQLGEVLFHSNPLHGKPFAGAREPFERLLSYEPDHAVSLVHLARIASREQRLSGMDSLVQRYVELNPEGDRELEMLALQAFAHRDPRREEEVTRRLERASDLTLALAIWDVATWTDNIDGAERVARLLTTPSRSAEERTLGHAWLAHVKLAKGQWQGAKQELAAMASLDLPAALEYRALLSSLPFAPTLRSELVELRAALQQLDPATIPASGNPSVFYNVHDELHHVLRAYLLGLVNVRLGDTVQARRHAATLEQLSVPTAGGTTAVDLAHSIRAQVALHRGDTTGALTELNQIRRQTWYVVTLPSTFYSQTFERFTRAELLYALGRDREALQWYDHLVEIGPYEVGYRPLAHHRRAQIYERLGDEDQALEHYARFVELWKDADPELQPQVEDVRRRIAALVGEGRR